MKLLVVTSESHRELYEKWFLRGLPSGADLEMRQLGTSGNGRYESEEWKTGVMTKLDFVRDFCRACPGETFVLSDVDIQFFAGFKFGTLEKLLVDSGRDILFQKERSGHVCPEVNTGFYVARASPWVASLIEKALALAVASGERNDQTLVNTILADEEQSGKWGHLPPQYYARSHGFPPPCDIVLHHANMTTSMEEKLSQLRRIRTWVGGGWARRLAAILGESAHYLRSGKLGAMLRRKLGRTSSTRNSSDQIA